MDEYDFKIVLVFDGSVVLYPSLLISVLEQLEEALRRSDAVEIRHAARALKLPRFAMRYARLQSDAYRGQRFRITTATRGSLELELVVYAIGSYVLAKTVSEVFKDAFKESKLGIQLKEYLVRTLDENHERVARALKRGLRIGYPDRRRRLRTRVEPHFGPQRRIEIEIWDDEQDGREKHRH